MVSAEWAMKIDSGFRDLNSRGRSNTNYSRHVIEFNVIMARTQRTGSIGLNRAQHTDGSIKLLEGADSCFFPFRKSHWGRRCGLH